MKIAVYPGSFDPVTFGHIDIAERAAKIFDKLIIAVMVNPHKNPLFSIVQRTELIRASVSHIPNIEVDSFPGLLVHYLQRQGAQVIVKGLRAVSDFESELSMASINWKMYPAAETVFIPTNTQFSYISSSLVKEIARNGGSIRDFVPPHVEGAVMEAYRRQLNG
ncbi:pantetheine-phosphate adenylyltransferase [Effusibacillus lacus]|uniref:Phosphopantetheine adenylyltransferase n=1 Tax=Effusibacillus lacus TaxID=1348429 RepID=A0A292YDN7_9BACL|nr:pantetheine-phosphate adenylyltransferase [Effusibacillus lacus]TCS76572.1 phosphopantetheine adenylyltransferase [Effusibacillus lacus]GAX90412.1 pantetheine-phosphate adenylyltransferase [Effusibacillus lacus]